MDLQAGNAAAAAARCCTARRYSTTDLRLDIWISLSLCRLTVSHNALSASVSILGAFLMLRLDSRRAFDCNLLSLRANCCSVLSPPSYLASALIWEISSLHSCTRRSTANVKCAKVDLPRQSTNRLPRNICISGLQAMVWCVGAVVSCELVNVETNDCQEVKDLFLWFLLLSLHSIRTCTKLRSTQGSNDDYPALNTRNTRKSRSRITKWD